MKNWQNYYSHVYDWDVGECLFLESFFTHGLWGFEKFHTFYFWKIGVPYQLGKNMCPKTNALLRLGV